MLIAGGLVIGAALLTRPGWLVIRRCWAAFGSAVAVAGPPRSKTPGAGRPRIVVADYERLVVTASQHDETAYVLRPPGTDPAVILRAARLFLPQATCQELAERLGLPASWPITVADHDRLVVMQRADDNTVHVLRPRGVDPREVLRVARLVVPEDSYEELAEHLGLSAGWPIEKNQEGGL